MVDESTEPVDRPAPAVGPDNPMPGGDDEGSNGGSS